MVIGVIGLIAGILFLGQQFFYRRLWNRAVAVQIEFQDQTVRAGSRTVLTETVENRKWLPLPALKVKFQCSGDLIFAADGSSKVSDLHYRNDLFSLMPFRRITRRHSILCHKRGYYEIKGIDLVGADLFLSCEMLEGRPGETNIHVIPAFFETEELITAVRQLNGEILSKRHLLTDPFTLRGIREYTPFDEAKSVNWKATAKSEELKVNVYDFIAVSTVGIYMNLEHQEMARQEMQAEKAISICAYIAETLLKAGTGLSLYANSRDCLHHHILAMEENRDPGCLEHIYKMLARIDLNLGTESFTQCFEEQLTGSRGQILVFISQVWDAEFQELLGRVAEIRDIVWLCPCKEAGDVEIIPGLRPLTHLIPDRID